MFIIFDEEIIQTSDITLEKLHLVMGIVKAINFDDRNIITKALI